MSSGPSMASVCCAAGCKSEIRATPHVASTTSSSRLIEICVSPVAGLQCSARPPSAPSSVYSASDGTALRAGHGKFAFPGAIGAVSTGNVATRAGPPATPSRTGPRGLGTPTRRRPSRRGLHVSMARVSESISAGGPVGSRSRPAASQPPLVCMMGAGRAIRAPGVSLGGQLET